MDPLAAAHDGQGLSAVGGATAAAPSAARSGSEDELSPLSSPRDGPPAEGEPALPPQPPQPFAPHHAAASSVPVPVPRSSTSNGGAARGPVATSAAGAAGDDAELAAAADGLPQLSPADPDMTPEQLAVLLARHVSSPAEMQQRFSMADFLGKTNRAAVTTAARRELVGGLVDHQQHHGSGGSSHPHHAGPVDDDVAAALEDAGHGADLARQAAHLASLAASVAEEGKVNRELAGLLVERLEASKKAVDCCMRLLAALVDAEAAYSASMDAAAKAAAAGPLAAPSDSASLAAALQGLVALPAAAAAGHRQLHEELQRLAEGARGLWRRYTATAREIKQAVHAAQRGVDGCCKQLTASLAEHRSACEAFDAAVVWSSPQRGGSGSYQQQQQQGGRWHRRTGSAEAAAGDAGGQQRGSWGGAASAAAASAGVVAAALRPRFRAAPARDPWSTEGRLVVDQAALKRWQDQEREVLQRGFEALQVLEAERVTELLTAARALAASYPQAVQALPPAAQQLQGLLSGLGGAGEAGLQHLAKTAAEMRATSEELALRQAESLEAVAQELFCSPEIVRQGCMELWNPRTSAWAGCHFVLTRSGFLHWFKSMQDTTPLEAPLNLSRCEFEAGQAPAFHLVEAGMGGWLVGRGSRKVTLQAGSVEECCEWAIALREAIALSSSTGGPSGGAGSGSGSRLQ